MPLPVPPGTPTPEGEDAVICARCQKPIPPGKPYDKYIPDSGTGTAPTVYLHAELCKKVPHQSVPESMESTRY